MQLGNDFFPKDYPNPTLNQDEIRDLAALSEALREGKPQTERPRINFSNFEK